MTTGGTGGGPSSMGGQGGQGGTGGSAPDAAGPADDDPDGGAPDGGSGQAQDGGQGNGADASTRDAGPATPAPGLGGAASCTSSTGVLCEDFEKTAAGAVPMGWSRQGSAVASADGPARGMRTLLAKSAVNSNYSVNRLVRRQTIPGTHWGRIYYKVALPSPRPPSGVIHATFVTLTGNLAEGGRAAEFRVLDTVTANNNRHQFLYNVQPNGAREFGRGTSYNWMFDGRFHCAEWFIDEVNQEFRLYIDEGANPVLAFRNGPGRYTGSQIPKSFNGIHLGVTHYQNSRTGYNVSLDELVIDTKRVGCK
jgi:hypothetical protein